MNGDVFSDCQKVSSVKLAPLSSSGSELQMVGRAVTVPLIPFPVRFGFPTKTAVSVRFLPRCMECSRGIAMGFPSVCLSVRPSNECIVTKRKKAMFTFLYHMKEHLS